MKIICKNIKSVIKVFPIFLHKSYHIIFNVVGMITYGVQTKVVQTQIELFIWPAVKNCMFLP